MAHITDGVNGRQTRSMAYDGLDRLTQVTSNMFGTASYGYDVLDNLAHVQLSGGQARDQYYCYDSSWRLTNVKTSSCTGTTVVGLGYDVQGNLANKSGTTYAFDYGNRLRKVSRGETWIESYRYDAQGRRAYAWDPARGYILSQYAQDGRLMYQRDERVAKQRDQIYLGNSLVAIREQPVAGGTATVLYQHTDALGTPIAVTDANKALAQTSEYEPYGQLLNRTLTDGPGFTGHVQDATTGLTYMQQRYYDPGIGLFLSTDPVTAYSSPGTNFNRYWYANNNPYKFTDPDGRQVSAPHSCHSDNGCVSLEQAQAGIGRDGVLMMKILGGSAAAGAGSAVVVETGIGAAAVNAAKDKSKQKVAKEMICAALSLGNCGGKEQMKHPEEPRPEGQRVEDASRVAQAIKEWLRRNLGEQPGPPPPKPTPSPSAPNSSPSPEPPLLPKPPPSPCKVGNQC